MDDAERTALLDAWFHAYADRGLASTYRGARRRDRLHRARQRLNAHLTAAGYSTAKASAQLSEAQRG